MSSSRSIRRKYAAIASITLNDLEEAENDIDENVSSNSLSMPLEINDPQPFHVDTLYADNTEDISSLSSQDSELSSTSDECAAEMSLGRELACWSIAHNISSNALSSLLKKLKPFHSDLPLDARTLLKTPKQISYISLGDGQYAYCGVAEPLKVLGFCNSQVKIDINIDGLPLSRSGSQVFWPILGAFTVLPDKVFILAIFCGKSKPPIEGFLNPLIEDIHQHPNVSINFFALDAPARSFLKQTKQCGGYSACDYCDVDGTYLERRVVYLRLGINRTNESFRTCKDEDHHIGTSPLLRLPIDFISQFPPDYMHVVLLGCVRKLLFQWTQGALPFRLQARKINNISSHIIRCRPYIPSEFARKLRSLCEFKLWKATELRLFLLYIGPVVLKSQLDDDNYKHFLLLSMAIRLLSSNSNMEFLNASERLLTLYVEGSKRLYGNTSVTYVVHNLLHLVQFVKLYGSLDVFSCFRFENFLHSLKKRVRGKHLPLQQILNRIGESDQFLCLNQEMKRKPNTRILIGSTEIGNSNRDCCVELTDNSIGIISSIRPLQFQKYDLKRQYLNYPFTYEELHNELISFYIVGELAAPVDINSTQIKRKLMRLPYLDSFVTMPFVSYCNDIH